MHKMQRDLSASPLLPPCPCFTCGRDLLATWRKPSCLPTAMASAHAPDTEYRDCCKPAGILGTHTFCQSVCHARERYDSYDSYREYAARAPSSHTSHRRCQGPSSASQCHWSALVVPSRLSSDELLLTLSQETQRCTRDHSDKTTCMPSRGLETATL